jgi:hypothetical protein
VIFFLLKLVQKVVAAPTALRLAYSLQTIPESPVEIREVFQIKIDPIKQQKDAVDREHVKNGMETPASQSRFACRSKKN